MLERILVLGADWHGNFSFFLYRNLKKLGYQAELINCRNLPGIVPGWRRIRQVFFIARLNAQLKKTILHNSVSHMIITAPYLIHPSVLKEAKRKDVAIVAWLGDDPLRKGVPDHFDLYDKVYLIDPCWVARARFIHNNVAYLPHAADTGLFRPLEDGTIKMTNCDFLFVGDSFSGDANGKFRAAILKLLFQAGYSIKVCGDSGWLRLLPEDWVSKGILIARAIAPDELNRLYQSARIVLNIHHTQLVSGTNQRAFETSAAGAFQIADERPVLSELFGGAIVTFSSPGDLLEKARAFLAEEGKRRSLADAARKLVLEGHTYVHRIHRLLT